MVPLDYVLTVVILITPPGEFPTAESQHYAHLARPLRNLGQFWEILDRREAEGFLTRPDDFPQDLDLLRRRYHDLADAPPASDAYRFPTRDTACELLTFNREYTRTLKLRREAVGPGQGDLDQALGEAEQLYRIWDLVRDARSECYYISVRRQALLNLRSCLGRDDYYRGVLPPHVPTWRFDRRD